MLTVDFAAMPRFEQDALCAATLRAVRQMFENPETKADFENWLKERKRGLENGQN